MRSVIFKFNHKPLPFGLKLILVLDGTYFEESICLSKLVTAKLRRPRKAAACYFS